MQKGKLNDETSFLYSNLIRGFIGARWPTPMKKSAYTTAIIPSIRGSLLIDFMQPEVGSLDLVAIIRNSFKYTPFAITIRI